MLNLVKHDDSDLAHFFYEEEDDIKDNSNLPFFFYELEDSEPSPYMLLFTEH